MAPHSVDSGLAGGGLVYWAMSGPPPGLLTLLPPVLIGLALLIRAITDLIRTVRPVPPAAAPATLPPPPTPTEPARE